MKQPLARPLLHVIAGLSPGGAENFLLKLLQRDEVLRAHSAILSVRPQDDLLPKFLALGIPVERQPLQADWRLPLRLWRIHRRIHAPGTRLVQSWLYLADSIASLSAQVLGRLPLAWGIRSSHGARGKRLTGLLAQRLNPWLSRRYVQRIVCCGERAREAHAALGYAPDKLCVIPNGYDTRSQRRDAAAGAALRAQLGIAPGAPVVGMAARIDTFKDHDTLLAAAALLIEEMPGLRLLLCGKGTDGETLRRRAQSLGLGDHLIGLGVRHDMTAVYSALDAHVLSSFTEGFPNVVAEAALHGCVSFSTPVGEAPEMLGDPRWLVPVGDAPAMARALADCLRQSPQQRAAWADAQRQRIEQHYELERVAALYRQTYNQLVPGLLPTESA
ncbi:glycosyltransferase [Scleromatobacter humisilvae]|uniref:Glycosyltransferase n=1 Tax=Scleromatobacter humisilvae TaxID=2897159 RepID=A0A9X1YPN3_9BURK|nr:glycosyltransferase [Scleromatobacter humisilvae]MCK9688357.1 glycosyltransferase [Scleromatobacter humisilvae]